MLADSAGLNTSLPKAKYASVGIEHGGGVIGKNEFRIKSLKQKPKAVD